MCLNSLQVAQAIVQCGHEEVDFWEGTMGATGRDLTLLKLLAGAIPAPTERHSYHPQAYDGAFRRVEEGVRETQKRLLRDRRHGQFRWTVLEKHPQARRLVMIHNDRRLQSWGLYRFLLDRSRSLAAHDARVAAELAELALAVARNLDPDEHGEERIADFLAGAFAALAEAKRRLSDQAGAWELFNAARENLGEGTGDPLERAEMEMLRARLLRDSGREQEADEALRRAGNLFRRIGDSRLETGDHPEDDSGHDTDHPRARRRG
jgi:hypothetical protein